MSDTDTDFESQEPSDIDANSPHQTSYQKLVADWCDTFRLSRHDEAKWAATHIRVEHPQQRVFSKGGTGWFITGATYVEPNPDADEFVFTDDLRSEICVAMGYNTEAPNFKVPSDDVLSKVVIDAESGWYDAEITYAEFEKYNEVVRPRFARHANKFRGYTFDELVELDDGSPPFLLQGAIPHGAITIAYGPRKIGKSRWLHKLVFCVADVNDLLFDGEAVEHGRVLYLSIDPGARADQNQFVRRLKEVRARLGAQLDANFILVSDRVDLTDAASVEKLLDKHPGKFALVVIDSLYRAVPGDDDLVDPRTMKAAIEGAEEISAATGAAVILVQHTGRGNQNYPYGSNWQEAGASALIKFEGKDTEGGGGTITATVEFTKDGGDRKEPFRYRGQGSFLESLDVIPQGAPAALAIAEAPHREMLELIPGGKMSVRAARKLIEHLLTGDTAASHEKQWERVRKAWADAGLITQRDQVMWRAVP